ncbi:cupin domain-containing protein [Sedimentitalea sp. JM2-8]|uniref:Cupin domain-containing protein n=1 Tax=Sedimentitalea xiamensis TaxID=3050037 RepID=A0ABT7FJB1_9RHOB|nr:cupin domain-containing protein [Sedimentitalea xiamensis]MDK3075233.1 cupin domain-containing protein [Sedimentitalea xiamensis]
MDIFAAGSRPTLRARSEWFTGTVWQDPVIEAPAPARVRVLRVSFEPGARTAWHRHPLGQTLHVTEGCGLIGLRDQPPRVIRPGDTVWIPPEEQHWHGAGPETGMVHIAIQEAGEDGATATWLDHVTDAEYGADPTG